MDYRRTIFVLGFLLLAIGIAVFARGLNVPFVFDDEAGIVENLHIRQLWPLSQSLTAPTDTSPYGRPIAAFSLAVTYAICGLSPWGYHLFSLMVHLANGLLVYDLLRRTLVSHKIRVDSVHAAPIAFGVALLWMVHPLQTDAVTYASQRTELLFSFFLLLAMWSFVRGCGRTRWTLATIGTCAMGMACKEAMVVAPLLVLLYDRQFISHGFSHAWRAHRSLYIGLLLTWMIVIGLSLAFPRSQSAGFYLGKETGITAWNYLLTQNHSIVHYLRQVIWPDRLSIDIHIPIVQTVADCLPAGLFVVAMLVLTACGVIFRSLLGFLGAWFFLILAPSSSIVPVVTEIAAERRMYLPLLALMILLMLAVGRILRFISNRITCTVLLFIGFNVILAIMFSVTTIVRIGTHTSPIRLYEDAVAKFPANVRARRNLAATYMKMKAYDLAISEYEQAIDLDPLRLRLHYDLGVALVQSGSAENALAHFQYFRTHEPDDVKNLNALGSAYARTGQFKNAESLLREAIAVYAGYAPAYDNLAHLYRLQNKPVAAESILWHYLELKPDEPEAHNELGVVMAQQGRMVDAVEQFRIAIHLDPDFAEAQDNLERARRLLDQ